MPSRRIIRRYSPGYLWLIEEKEEQKCRDSEGTAMGHCLGDILSLTLKDTLSASFAVPMVVAGLCLHSCASFLYLWGGSGEG